MCQIDTTKGGSGTDYMYISLVIIMKVTPVGVSTESVCI